MNSLTVRTVKPGDLESIYKIERLSFQRPYPSSYLETLAYLSPKTFIVASIKNQIVGYSASVLRDLEGHIISIAVHPDYRGMSIGERLLRESLERFKRLGVKRAVLEVGVGNTPAIRLYRKVGFKISRVLKSYYWNGEDAYEMVLKLEG